MFGKRFGGFGVAALLACGALAAPAFAQSTYPTAAGANVKVPGVVPLQCDASGQTCAPVSVANPLQVSGGGGGGGGTQYAEDAVAASGNTGTVSLGVQVASPASTAADGDWTWQQFTNGKLHTIDLTANTAFGVPGDAAWASGSGAVIPLLKTLATAALDTTTPSPVKIDQTTVGTTNAVSLAQIGATTVASGNGVVSAGVQRVAIASDNTAFSVNNTPATIAANGTNSTGTGIVPAAALAQGDDASIQAITENSFGNTRMSLTNHALVTRPFETEANSWQYASGTTGILSNTTTAVTFKASAGAGLRNYITGCQITTTAFGAAVPLAIRDGAGGTVIWSVTVPTAGFLQPVAFQLSSPIRGTAATLLEIVTTTANTSGTAMVNCQGFVAP